MRRSGMTLIELLVCIGLGVLMTALTARAMLHVQLVRDRGSEQLAMHRQLAAIADAVGPPLRSTQHPSLWDCVATPGATGDFADNRATLTLTWMAASPEREADAGAYGRLQNTDLVWWRLRWQGQGRDTQGRGLGTLSLACSSGWRTPSIPGANPFYVFIPQPRRDRRRDLDDNDLRFEPGITAAVRSGIGAIGDGSDLDRRLLPLHPGSVTVESCTIAWLDHGGASIVYDSATGITARDAIGGAIAVPGNPSWFTTAPATAAVAQRITLDGLWLDGRQHVLAPDTRSASSQRPSLVRLRLGLRSLARASGDSEPLRQEFRLSIPTAPDLPSIP